MVDGKIYILSSPNTEKIYIGSTTRKYLSQRIGNHFHAYKRFLDGKKDYCSSYEIIKVGGAKGTLLKEYKDISKEELRRLEKLEASNYPNRVNIRDAIILNKKEYFKQYYQNKKEYFKQYYQNKKK